MGRSTPSGGVQNERTSLAWVRTALGLAACALLTGRLAMVQDASWAVVAAVAAASLGFGVLGWSHDRYRRAARAVCEQRPVDRAVPALLVTLAACLVGALALLLIVL
ncbi:DUF202 domain-containing protein [Actinophytocola sp.]|uniref:DUF202 domain-containing protein n=1 Tax=Actinophytocola sp. TaxID=1872138 RepID=UPI003D6A915F